MTVPGNLVAPLLGAVNRYSIPYALRLRASNSANLSRTLGVAANRTTWTLSMWVKRGLLGTNRGSLFGVRTANNDTDFIDIGFYDTDKLQINGGSSTFRATTMQFRDPSAWYHIMVATDTNQGTANNRIRVYVNGSEVTAFDTLNNPGSGANTAVGQATDHRMCVRFNSVGGLTEYFDGVIAHPYLIFGQQLTPSSFGQTDATSGQWVPKAYSGTYGSNDSFLAFADASAATAAAIGKDSSGNGNNWTPSGISVTSGTTFDQLTDTPTNNYATYNALLNGTTYVTTFSEANMSVTKAGGTASPAVSTIGALTGKYYAEFVLATIGTAVLSRVGVTGANNFYSSTYFIAGEFDPYGSGGNGVGYFANGTRRINNSDTALWGSTYTTSDVIGVAFDAGTGKVWFAKNGTWQASGDPAAGTNPAATLTTGVPFWFTHQMLDSQWRGNFGQRPFAYTPPTGFLALNTANLSAPTIPNGANYMLPVLRTGTGATASVSSLAFQPDLVWIKSRSNATNNVLFDSTRGTTNYLISNSTADAATNANTLTAFNSNGYSLGTDAGSIGVNINTNTYVDWSWKKGVTPGFDIVSYTGNGANRTISHSLGAVPNMMFVKARTTAGADTGWAVYHSSLANTEYLVLESTAAKATGATYWNSTTPTSSVFSVGTAAAVNTNSDTYIAYLWASIPGFSLMSSYTGNGSSDGPFVWCGFKPRFILIKRTDTAGNGWWMIDTVRQTYNQITNGALTADSSAAEGGAGYALDVVSNGFKPRGTGSDYNTSGAAYIFAAFAESPFKYSTAR